MYTHKTILHEIVLLPNYLYWSICNLFCTLGVSAGSTINCHEMSFQLIIQWDLTHIFGGNCLAFIIWICNYILCLIFISYIRKYIFIYFSIICAINMRCGSYSFHFGKTLCWKRQRQDKSFILVLVRKIFYDLKNLG